MALTAEEKSYFDQQFTNLAEARQEDRAYFTGLFNTAMRETAKKLGSVQQQFDSIDKRLTSVEHRLDVLDRGVGVIGQDLREIKLDLQDVRSRVFDTVQRKEWLSLVYRVEKLEKGRE